MQIVIDIDENIYTRLFDNGIEDYEIVNDDLFSLAKAIRKGEMLQEPKTEGDCISRAELLKAIDTWDKFGFEHTGCFVREPKDDFTKYVHYDDVIKCIKGMPSVQQEPKTEIEELNFEELDFVQEHKKIPITLDLTPNEDAISRQAVLKAIDAKAWEFCDYLISKNRNDEQKPVSHFADNLRECISEDLPPVTPQPKTGHCKDCKWWKDSDGLYRRGSHAESKCPINRKEVLEGNGYCYMFEQQKMESEVQE